MNEANDAELERLRAEQPAHPHCTPCRKHDHENCAHLVRPTSCGCGCPWLIEGRPPRPTEDTRERPAPA